MTKALKIVMTLLLISPAGLLSQQLSHQVLVPLAGIKSDSKISYTQTVGETAVETMGCYDYIFTQGFQQPGIRYNGEERPKGTGIKVYPNPVADLLTVELFGESSRDLTVEIIDITGTVVVRDKKSFSSQYWLMEQYNIENLIRGFYLVRVLTSDGFLNKSVKIEKL